MSLIPSMKIYKKTLKNKLRLILIPQSCGTKLVSVGFFIGVGSRNEFPNYKNGISHYLEHIVFSETRKRGSQQLFQELDTFGFNYNAVTTTEYTEFYISGNSHYIDNMLDIIVDLYIGFNPSVEKIDQERNVILAEMKTRSDNIFFNIINDVHETYFESTSLGQRIIGTPASVKSITKKDLEIYHKIFYQPRNTLFVIVGDFDPSIVYPKIKNSLDNLTNVYDKPIDTYSAEKKIIIDRMINQSELVLTTNTIQNIEQTYIYITFPIYDWYNYKNQEIDILSMILSGGISSRLVKYIREDLGLSYNITSYPVTYRDVGFFTIQAVFDPTDVIIGFDSLINQLQLIKHSKINDNEITKAINLIVNETQDKLIKPLDIMEYIGPKFMFNPDNDFDLEKTFHKLKSVTESDIHDLAQKIFSRDKINIFIHSAKPIDYYDKFIEFCEKLI